MKSESKHAIVIGKDGRMINLILVELVEDNGVKAEIPYSYTIKDDERLIYNDLSTATSMTKPQWNGKAWEETATPEEIAAARPEPDKPQLSDLDIVLLAIDDIYKKISGGAA